VCVLSSGTINSKRALWALSSWPGKHSLSLYTRSQLPRPSIIGLKKPGEREGNGRGFGFLRHRFWLAAATRTYHTRHAPSPLGALHSSQANKIGETRKNTRKKFLVFSTPIRPAAFRFGLPHPRKRKKPTDVTADMTAA
jgi:hypothetical protein